MLQLIRKQYKSFAERLDLLEIKKRVQILKQVRLKRTQGKPEDNDDGDVQDIFSLEEKHRIDKIFQAGNKSNEALDQLNMMFELAK